MAAPRLVYLRHGETTWNAIGRLQGQQDTPLSERGRAQAHAAGLAAGTWMRANGLDPIEMPYVASPLQRTRDTMELARRAMGLPAAGYATDDRLKEISFGAWEKHSWPQVRTLDPSHYAARKADKWNVAPPGGESYADLAGRVGAWLAAIERDTVVVSHGGVARVLMVMIAGADPATAPDFEIAQGRPLIFDEGRHTWA